MVECKKKYNEKKIKPIFTLPYIDIYELKEDNNTYKIKNNWENIIIV